MAQDERKISDVINQMLQQGKLKNKYSESLLPEIWRDIMNPMIVSYTDKIELVGQTVKIYIRSAPLRQELIMGKDQIKDLFNQKLEHVTIKYVNIY